MVANLPLNLCWFSQNTAKKWHKIKFKRKGGANLPRRSNFNQI